jgi:hypothetical protein
LRRGENGPERHILDKAWDNGDEQGEADAQFTAYARADIPWLLAQHATLIAERDDLQAGMEMWHGKFLAMAEAYLQAEAEKAAAESALDEARRQYQELRAATTPASDLDHAGVVLVAQANAQDSELVDTLTEALDEARKARDVTEGVSLIAVERARQMSVEGWTPAHDDEHHRGELAVSAARYALHDTAVSNRIAWQWESYWWKPKDPIRNLVRAGALIAAEIDRRLRASPSPVRVDPPAQGTAKGESND